MRIFWKNELDKYTLSANSEEGYYPVANVQDYQLAKVYRSTDDTAEWVKVDAGSGNTITATGACILGHNLTNGGTYKIQGNATDSWGSPSLDETFSYDSDIMIETFDSAEYRFWRFSLADDSNPDTHLEIGRLFLGTYLEFADQPSKDFPLSYEDTSSVEYSITGQAFGDEGIIYKLYNFKYPYWTDTVRKNVVTMIEDIKLVKPVILVPDENNTDKLVPVYAKLNDNLSLNHLVAYAWNGILSWRECF